MIRFLAGGVSALLLAAAGFFFWQGRAGQEALVPPAPGGAGLAVPLQQEPIPEPPSAPEKTKEERRFARYDEDNDGRITRAEMMETRRSAWKRLDTDGNGSLSFEEWAVATSTRFAGADANRDGSLSPEEFETTRPKPRPKQKCAC